MFSCASFNDFHESSIRSCKKDIWNRRGFLIADTSVPARYGTSNASNIYDRIEGLEIV
jgi:hypothetical protein